MNRRTFIATAGASLATGAVGWYAGTQTDSGRNTLDTVVQLFQKEEPGRRPRNVWNDIYFDKAHGLIVHEDGNGGDTAQREGMYWLAKWFYANRDLSSQGRRPARLAEFQPWRKASTDFPRIIQLLQKEPGLFVRHPTDGRNGYNRPDKMSRDNILPLIAAMGVWGLKKPLDDIYDRLTNQRGVLSYINEDNFDAFRQYLRRARNIAVEEDDRQIYSRHCDDGAPVLHSRRKQRR